MNRSARKQSIRDRQHSEPRQPIPGKQRALMLALAGLMISGGAYASSPAQDKSLNSLSGQIPVNQQSQPLLLAQTAQQRFNIPPGPLAATLNRFADETGLQLIYSAGVAAGLRTAGVSGTYPPSQALQLMLANTGLAYRFTGDNTVTLERQSSVAADQGGSSTSTEVPTSSGSQDTVGIVTLPQVNVTEDVLDEEYNVPNASTGTKTDTPIMETPLSIQVVPQQVLEDQQVIRLEDALTNVSGIIKEGSTKEADIFNIRGFRTNNIYRDGVLFPDIFGDSTNRRETANVERIEVLKGPGSLLYGRADPGGIINIVTKQPLDTPYYSAQQQIGSFDFYRTTFDASGPITQDDSLLYRFNLAYQNAGSFREFVDSERIFFAPVLRWNIAPRTQFSLELEYLKDDFGIDSGAPSLGNRPAPVSRERSLGESFDKGSSERLLAGFHWSHKYDNEWILRQRFTAEQFETFQQASFFFGPVDETSNTVDRGFFFEDDVPSKRYFTNLELTGDFKTGGLKHTFLLGGDYFREDLASFVGCCGEFPSLDIFNPTHVAQPPLINPADFSATDLTGKRYGLFLQDQIELPNNLFALAGLRYDQAEQRNNIDNITDQDEDRVSPRGGLLWRPIPALSLYGSYSENFGSSNGLDTDGKALPPQTAQQWEVGIKSELDDGRLTGTLAYFDLTRQNTSEPDPDNPLRRRAIGEAESRGVELDVSGEILPGWRIIGAYAYLPFAEFTRDVDDEGGAGNTGNRLPTAPRHAGSIFSTYEFESENLRGLKLGAGVVAVGQREGDPSNSYQIPGYGIVNLLGSYSWSAGASKVTAQVNVDNLFDKTYHIGSDSFFSSIPFGAPRTVLGSIRIEF